jgi:hypothetical protein
VTAEQSVSHIPAKPSPHFDWSEFRCHDQFETCYPIDWREDRGVKLAIELERIRARIGAFTPSSVYRTWAYHKAIYAQMRPPQTPPASSQHLYGRAADVPCPESMTFAQFVGYVKMAAAEPGSLIRYIKFYRADAFAHVDIREAKTLKVEFST